jgi:rare lipoprotein A
MKIILFLIILSLTPLNTISSTSSKKIVKIEYKGIASWYGTKFHGKKRADGKIYNMHNISVAHKTLPLGTVLRITNLNNNETILARVNDRGPYIKGRMIDLSLGAAKRLNAVKLGLIPVTIRILS